MHLLFKAILTVTFFETILSTLRAFTSTLATTLFCYYFVPAGKKFLLFFNSFHKEAFQLASAHS